MAGHFLIVEARFYEEIVDAQVVGSNCGARSRGSQFCKGFRTGCVGNSRSYCHGFNRSLSL